MAHEHHHYHNPTFYRSRDAAAWHQQARDDERAGVHGPLQAHTGARRSCRFDGSAMLTMVLLRPTMNRLE